MLHTDSMPVLGANDCICVTSVLMPFLNSLLQADTEFYHSIPVINLVLPLQATHTLSFISHLRLSSRIAE